MDRERVLVMMDDLEMEMCAFRGRVSDSGEGPVHRLVLDNVRSEALRLLELLQAAKQYASGPSGQQGSCKGASSLKLAKDARHDCFNRAEASAVPHTSWFEKMEESSETARQCTDADSTNAMQERSMMPYLPQLRPLRDGRPAGRVIQLLTDIESEVAALRALVSQQGTPAFDHSVQVLVQTEGLRFLASLRSTQKAAARAADPSTFLNKTSWQRTLSVGGNAVATRRMPRKLADGTPGMAASEPVRSPPPMFLPQLQPIKDGVPLSGGPALFSPRTRDTGCAMTARSCAGLAKSQGQQ
eukprot:m51a1_g7442 hypothetical protein (299) ;mRNA; f:86692-90794